jgi:tRNA (cytidine/uridine-2'-O-)-methyltransferase
MFHLVLYEPEIPPNTGNIIRLCANTGSQLHLIEPLGFDLDDTRLRRAGLDYDEFASVKTWPDLESFIDTIQPARLYALSTKGHRSFFDVAYKKSDAFLFGPETRGLPEKILKQMGREHVLRLPMQSDSRSLNLSNSAAIVIYEAWRQIGFEGGA